MLRTPVYGKADPCQWFPRAAELIPGPFEAEKTQHHAAEMRV